jgi:hypothetical protein
LESGGYAQVLVPQEKPLSGGEVIAVCLIDMQLF